jgi:hypothetical protein
MWQSGNQLRRESQVRSAKTLGFRMCHTRNPRSLNFTIVFLHVKPPSVHAGNGRAFTVLTSGAGGLTLI